MEDQDDLLKDTDGSGAVDDLQKFNPLNNGVKSRVGFLELPSDGISGALLRIFSMIVLLVCLYCSLFVLAPLAMNDSMDGKWGNSGYLVMGLGVFSGILAIFLWNSRHNYKARLKNSEDHSAEFRALRNATVLTVILMSFFIFLMTQVV